MSAIGVSLRLMQHVDSSSQGQEDAIMPNIKVFAGNSNPELAEKIVARLGIKLSEVKLKKFSNKETRYTVRGSFSITLFL